MNRILFFAVGLLISIDTLAQTPESNLAWVVVKTDYGMGRKVDTIRFVVNDGYTQEHVVSLPDENGTFIASFNISNSIDILWGFKKDPTLPLIISPNDTLNITINSATEGILFGKRARTCSNLMDMYEAKNLPRFQVYSSEFNREPEEFVGFMSAKLNQQLTFANKFCKSTKCTKTFVTWYIKSVYVGYYMNLVNYCHYLRKQSFESQESANRFTRSRDFVLREVDLNDPTLEMSSNYYTLLKNIFNLYVSQDDFRDAYYNRASSLLLKKQSNLVASEVRALKNIQGRRYSVADMNVFQSLMDQYREELRKPLWDQLDQQVGVKLKEISDEDIRRVIIGYFKGIRYIGAG